MEVEYNLTVEDILAFLRSQRQHGLRAKGRSRPKTSWARNNWIWILLFFVSMAYYWFTKGDQIAFVVASILSFLAGGFAVFFLLMWTGRAATLKRLYEDEHSRWLLSQCRLAISHESIYRVNEYEKSVICWLVVWKIDVTEDHAFLYTSTLAAQIVPRRAFRDRQHFEEFVALARKYRQGRGQPVPKSTGILAGLPPQPDAFTRPESL